MGKKLITILIIWGALTLVYIMLAMLMPVITTLTASANTSMASGNMTGIPGVAEATNAFPLYVWFIPGGVGIIGTIIVLKKD